MIAAVLAGAARAQGVDLEPDIDAQLYRPAVDSAFLWVDDGRVPARGPYGSLVAHYTRSPLRYYTGVAVDPVVADVVQTDLVLGYGVGPARLGAVVPVVARATGWAGSESGLGDLGLTGRGSVHTRAADLAVDGRLWFPTARLEAAVASRGMAGEIAAVGSRDLGRALLAANLGYRAVPSVRVGEAEVDDALTARFGGALRASDALALTAELGGQLGLGGRAGPPPIEALGGARVALGDWSVQGGVGRGLTTAIGTPGLRALVAVAYTRPAPPPALDTDGDALADPVDDCVRLREDWDGWRDEDGCPEDTYVTARVVDERGGALPHLMATLSGPGSSRTFESKIDLDLPAGTYTLTASDATWLDAVMTFTVAEGPPQQIDLVMHPRRVKVTRERIVLDEEIHFQSGSAVILEDSWRLLDEVAAQVLANPDIARLRIEGHTDAAGDDEANLDLSFQRATSVRSWLVNRGVDPARLTAVGYGESQPLAEGEDAAAHALNRRVEFFVEQWRTP